MNAIQGQENTVDAAITDYTAGGVPLPSVATLRADSKLIARYEAKIDKGDVGEDDCWEWTASKDEKGYGRMRVYDTLRAAHRLAFALANGRWPSPSLMVMHSCDNPGCVNPLHLSEGTATDNNRDAAEKGHHQNGYTKEQGQGQLELRERTHLEKGSDSWRTGPTESMLTGPSRLTAYNVLQIRKRIGDQRPIPRDVLADLAGEHGVSIDVIRRAALGRSFSWVTSQHGAGAGGSW